MTSASPTLAYDLSRDVTILSAMASNLTPYLYEDELYGYLAGDLPRLTVGGVLLRLYRLARLSEHLSADEQTQVQDARLNFEAERNQWAAHYDKKLVQELNARLRSWEHFLAECAENRRECASSYPNQAEKRTIIAHLATEASERNRLSDDTARRIIQIDQRLHQLFEPGAFLINDVRLQAVYLPEEFWWLYGNLAENNRA